jgi:hypothetical protein
MVAGADVKGAKRSQLKIGMKERKGDIARFAKWQIKVQ